MSLNQKYTWKDHLAECGKCGPLRNQSEASPKKGKRPKRTSKEASACFEKAFQAHIKGISRKEAA